MLEYTTACPDWRDRIRDGRSIIPVGQLYPWPQAPGLRTPIETFGDLRIVDAPGQPRLIESSKPWLMDFTTAVFGAYDPETGRRAIREFLLLIAKKNSKSTTASSPTLPPLGWEHIALTGGYVWSPADTLEAFRPLRDVCCLFEFEAA